MSTLDRSHRFIQDEMPLPLQDQQPYQLATIKYLREKEVMILFEVIVAMLLEHF
jgi:hypothetical protein